MPAVHFRIRLPDGSEQRCYSPSTVIERYLTAGERYTQGEFLRRVSAGLDAASARVEVRFGYACTSAFEQKRALAALLADYAGPPGEIAVLELQHG